MNQTWPQQPFFQTENGYNTRIRYLEEVVHLLIARTNLVPPSPISSPPLSSSFRYSTERGLIPLLSKGTAESLEIASRSDRTYYFNPSPHTRSPTAHLISARLFKPRPRSCPIVTRGKSPLSVLSKDENATRDPKSARPAILTAPPPVLNKFGSSATGPDHWSSSNMRLTCSSRPPSCASVTGLSSQNPDVWTFLCTASKQLSSPDRAPSTSTDAAFASKIAVTAQDPTAISPLLDPSAQTAKLPTSGSDPATSPTSSHSKNNLSPRPSTPDTTNTSDHDPISVIVIKADNPLPTSFLTNHIACTAATATQMSLTPNQTMANTLPSTLSSSDCTPTKQCPKSENILSSIVTPPELAAAPLAPPESFESKSVLSSTTNCSSSLICPTAQNCLENLEVAAVGGIEILDNDDIDSIEAQIAPEYSQATLDYYNDIQEYLQQANADETETKKKRKKKKKANPTSTPNNPVLFYV
ncbi:uncharacterized protein PGTG_06836 [Puccinia graminis f. sp. tritici CRL 75-36-700-3]|uniref:Uncharacterized protein n=1 Tax=Puccinia graminis f. sp. tritici (strain CRL 75-36-700-3 / race SCCL) TaxID=418459 RepID=E3KAY1_PUCGT|nr:uncharacterized protein PGTG_06836 [Puccinia graminis f. sp. tritici CRL 75-36-700-3]EFP81215.2 hypothetical protein PGTG_06836 [Puccinia graminis f. sp. tritici CRL 75-36-700-3]